MKEQDIRKFDSINVNAIIGSSRKFIIRPLNVPPPPNRKNATNSTFPKNRIVRKKNTGCRGCSRRRAR